MENTVTVPKIGTGTDENSVRPLTTASQWEVIEERASEFVIRILKE